jgi:hypothetical protein
MLALTVQPCTLTAAALCGAAGLHSEQLALVDMLVLARGKKFVGSCWSTFSTFTRDLRALRGLPKSTFLSVTDCSRTTFLGFVP